MNDVFGFWSQLARIGVESQMVIALRVAGMMGLLPHSQAETRRMVAEKTEAAFESTLDAWRCACGGSRPDEVARALLRPYGKRTNANARRLMRGALS